jgi:hypothetical protein
MACTDMMTILQNLVQKQGAMLMGMQSRLDSTDATVASLKQKVEALERAPPVVAPPAAKTGKVVTVNVEFRKECDYTEDELNATNKPALQALCVAHNLPKTANKPALIQRLLKNTDVVTVAPKGRAKASIEPRDEADYTEDELNATTNACLAAICKYHGLKKPLGKPELIKNIMGYVNSDNKSEYTANKKPAKRKKPAKAPEPKHNHEADGTTHTDCDHCIKYGDITDPNTPMPYVLSPQQGQTVDEALAALENKDIDELLNSKDDWELEQTLLDEDGEDQFSFDDDGGELMEEE